MTLQEALNIGTQADGYIKCSYAELHSTIGAKVWSINRSVYASNEAREEFTQSVSAADETYYMTDLAQAQDEKMKYLVVDMPIVIVDGDPVYSPDGKWLQVVLTDWCKDFILRKTSKRLKAILVMPENVPQDRLEYGKVEDFCGALFHARVRYRRAEADYNKALEDYNSIKAGGVVTAIVLAVYESRLNKAQEERQAAREALDKVYEQIREQEDFIKKTSEILDQPLWVKVVAIDWIPTNVDKATITVEQNGKTIDLKQALKASKAKLDKAKRLMVIAGASAFII